MLILQLLKSQNAKLVNHYQINEKIIKRSRKNVEEKIKVQINHQNVQLHRLFKRQPLQLPMYLQII